MHQSRRSCVGRLAVYLLSPVLFLLPLTTPMWGQTQSSAVPRLVSYSGVLKDAVNRIVTGIAGVTFLIYKDEIGGAPLWLETQNVRADATGHYTVQLGSASTHGLPAEIFMSGEGRWLALQIGSEPEQPRVLLVAVPYAMKAADAETLGGLPLSAFVLSASAGRNSTAAANGDTTAPAAAPPTTSSVTTSGGTANAIPMFTGATDIENSIVTQTGSGTTARIGINTAAPSATLDVKGSATVRGILGVPSSGTATATAGKNSYPFLMTTTAFNSGTGTSVTQNFRWQGEPVGNNTTITSGKLNLLFYSGTNAPTETGLSIASTGQFSFASGQTFPGTGTITGVTAGSGLIGGGTNGNVSLSLLTSCSAGQELKWSGTAWVCSTASTGTITGVIAGTDLIGGGTTGSVTLNVDPTKVVTGVVAGTALTGGGAGGVQTLNLDTTKVPQLATANTFTGNQTMNGNLIATTVGIGTAAPLAPLHIDHKPVTGGQDVMMITSALSGDVASLLLQNTAPGLRLREGAGTDAAYIASSGPLRLVTADKGTPNNPSVAALTIDTLGRVGIGIAGPAYTLDVSGTSHFSLPISFAATQNFPGAALLNAANTFTGNQTVNGNLNTSGTLIGGNLNVGGGGVIGGGLTLVGGLSMSAGATVGAGLSVNGSITAGDNITAVGGVKAGSSLADQ